MIDPFIARLRDERQRQRVSQRRLALDTNIGHGHLSQIETGKVDPKISTVRRIAARLGVPF